MPRTYKPIPPTLKNCWYCNKPVLGNAKRRYCNNRCKQLAKRARRSRAQL